MTVDQLQGILQTAVDHHRAGKLGEAERLYRMVLQAAPNHPQALHHLGIIAVQCGKPEIGMDLIRRSVAIEPSAAAFNNLGEALRALGRLGEAVDCYRKSISLDPRQVDAMANLGLALTSLNQLAEAERILRQGLSIAPDHLAASIALAKVLDLSADRSDDAVGAWERVVKLAPKQHAFHRSLGAAWIRAGDPYRAINALRRAIEIDPGDAESYARMANAFSKLKNSEQAVAAARKAAELAPDLWQSHFELATYLPDAGLLDEAIASYDRALALNPTNSSIYGARASALMLAERVDEAAESLVRGAALNPSDVRLPAVLSTVRFAQGDFASAVESARVAVSLEPHNVEGHASLAFALLAAGRFEDGFREYEWRWRDEKFTTKPRDFDQPMWDGSDPAGRRILVHSEQGFGDIFQFIRYVPMIRARGARVMVEGSYKIVNLLRRMAGDFTVVVSGTILPDFDLHVPLMSLPAILGTTLQTTPSCLPYLAADPGRAAQWRSKIGPVEGLRVGIVWAGNAKPDPKRSAKLADLAPLAAVPGITLISLQPLPEGKEADDPPGGLKLKNLGAELKDFSDTTASLLANLDLLITIDTGVAHLAGAMGVPTWIMLPFAPDWRWVHDREKSLWYPTVRLFRQTERGDWGSVVERIASELRAMGGTGS